MLQGDNEAEPLHTGMKVLRLPTKMLRLPAAYVVEGARSEHAIRETRVVNRWI